MHVGICEDRFAIFGADGEEYDYWRVVMLNWVWVGWRAAVYGEWGGHAGVIVGFAWKFLGGGGIFRF